MLKKPYKSRQKITGFSKHILKPVTMIVRRRGLEPRCHAKNPLKSGGFSTPSYSVITSVITSTRITNTPKTFVASIIR